MSWPLALGFAFLCGSVPFGLLIARARGVDIRKHGSGNIGATNVARVLGMRLGLLVFALDVLKGLLPVLIAGMIHGVAGRVDPPEEHSWWWLGAVVAAIFGHMFSPWVGFRGGKGVATGLGAMLGVFPTLTIAALGSFAIWMLTLRIWRYVGLSSCIAAITLPMLAAGFFEVAGSWRAAWPYLTVTALVAVIVTYKHRGNLKRAFAGTERRFGERETPLAPANEEA